MNDLYHKGRYVEDGISLGDLATEVFENLGISEEMYYIDPFIS